MASLAVQKKRKQVELENDGGDDDKYKAECTCKNTSDVECPYGEIAQKLMNGQLAFPGKKKVKQFRCRAETPHDVVKIMQSQNKTVRFSKMAYIHVDGPFPDVHVWLEATSKTTLQQIRRWFRTIDDSHVMTQTVKPADEYDGIRDWNIQCDRITNKLKKVKEN
jgi:hypothetical protein